MPMPLVRRNRALLPGCGEAYLHINQVSIAMLFPPAASTTSQSRCSCHRVFWHEPERLTLDCMAEPPSSCRRPKYWRFPQITKAACGGEEMPREAVIAGQKGRQTEMLQAGALVVGRCPAPV